MFIEPYLHREPEFSITIDVYNSRVILTAILQMHITGISLLKIVMCLVFWYSHLIQADRSVSTVAFISSSIT